MSTLLVQPAAATTPARAEGRIPILDGWRGVAILLVLLEHATQYGRFKDQSWTHLGTFGVDIFFVLSGFIITTRLIKERAEHGSIDLRGFYIRRAFRILPPIVTYLLALCLLSLFIDLADFHWQELAGSLFFFRNYQFAAHPRGLLTKHFWSLSIEEHFYLFWPALLLFISEKRILLVAFVGAVSSAAWRYYELAHDIRFTAALPGLQVCRTDSRLDGLLLGSLVAILLYRDKANPNSRTGDKGGLILIFLPAILVTLLASGGGPSFLLYLLIAIIIAYSVTVKKGALAWLLNFAPLVWVGEISYSLYVWQQLFLFHPDGLLPLGRLNAFPFNLACTVVVATCSFYFIERPAIKLGRRFYGRM
jgi:peptidoglycan/LPS O-acetylase OafA/YrhL